jgi:hypothetical protein
VKVLDQRLLRRDDEVEAKSAPADRNYWEAKATTKVVKLCDEVIGLLNGIDGGPWKPNYNRHYIGVTNGTKSSMFVFLRARKQFAHLRVQLADPDVWLEPVEEAGLDGRTKGGRLEVTLKLGDAKKHRDLLVRILGTARQEYEA